MKMKILYKTNFSCHISSTEFQLSNEIAAFIRKNYSLGRAEINTFNRNVAVVFIHEQKT